LDNPDHVAISIHNYRWRLGLADGERRYDDLEKRLAQAPVITVPTTRWKANANGAPHPEPSAYATKFAGRYAHRDIAGGIGHNLPQEAPEAFAQGGRRSRRLGICMSARPLLLASLLALGTAMDAAAQDKGALQRFGAPRPGSTRRRSALRSCAKGRAGRFLDLHLRQLDAHAALRARLGREVQGPGPRGDRRAHARVPFEKDLDNIQPCREEHARRLSGRGRPATMPCGRAFSNNAWPAVYLIDAQGRVRYRHPGEGE